MNEESPTLLEQSIKSIEQSSVKNNKLLIIFYLSTLYILVSVLNTSDLMLLLPTDTFKMPLIGFELNLIYFYVLAPIVLMLLHFNILFNYREHLEKLNAYKGTLTLETIDSSMYNYVYASLKDGSSTGSIVRIVLWLLIYLFPLLVFVAIFQRFADFHHQIITVLHLVILIVDIFLICYYLYENSHYHKSTWLSYLFSTFIIGIGVLELSYFVIFFYPLVYVEYKAESIPKFKEMGIYYQSVCKVHSFFLGSDRNEDKDCFPRIVVTDEKISNISPSTLYIPRYFVQQESTEERDREKNLILDYGERINLSNRNLRYANLENCILTRADMHGTQLQAAKLVRTHLQAVKFDNAQLQDTDMREAKLQNAAILHAKLQRASFIHADMTETYLDDSNLSGARMQGSNLVQTYFDNSILTNVNFDSANLVSVSFLDANLKGASFKNAKISNVSFEGAKNVDFRALKSNFK